MRPCTLVRAPWEILYWILANLGSIRYWHTRVPAVPHVVLRALELGGHSRHVDPRIEGEYLFAKHIHLKKALTA